MCRIYTFPSYFNPRSPCGERHTKAGLSQRFTRISIHAPRAGSDPTSKKSLGVILYFNPRSPCGERRRATRWQRSTARFQSTLPVRGATRIWTVCHRCVSADFNPRSPCGERLCSWRLSLQRAGISIHAPRAGSDGNKPHCRTLGTISIHAPRAGSDYLSVPSIASGA